MNFNHKLLLCCIFFLSISITGFSQINAFSAQNLSAVNIDNVADEEIKAYYQQATNNGLSDQNIYKLLRDKGLPEAEINKLTERISKLNLLPESNTAQEDPETKSDKNDRYSNKDANQVPMQSVIKDLTVFGSELFTSNSMVFEPNLRIPTPSGYILGPDDELIINVFGYSEKTYNVTVNEEGNIYIPQVGPVFINGLSIEQASGKIKAKLGATIYKAINSGQTRVQISLGKIRSIRVTVIGEATKPGTLTVSSLTTLFNLLYLCGGPSDFGSYRKIELIRGNQLKRTVDLYAFLLTGDQKDNILLKEGDIIRIPYYKTRVLLNGNVKRKGKYELIEGESFEQVLQISGGFTDDAFKSGITVYQLTETERKIIDVSKNEFGNYKPLSSDSIVVGQLLNRFENKLSIKGAVMRPGDYELSLGLTLKQLIEKAGGVKEDVYSKRGSIRRLNSNNTPIQVSFDIDSVLTGQEAIGLKKNDEITIYSIFDFKVSPNEVSIDGYVNKPGKYNWAENISLNDIILAAGGLSESADISNIEIARRIDQVNLSELNHVQTEILTVNLLDSANKRDLILKPFDLINVRMRPGFISQRVVIVEGMVTNPGRYTLAMSGDRINDLMKRAGGFRPNADTTAVIIRRMVQKDRATFDRERMFSKLMKVNKDSIYLTESIKKEMMNDFENISINLYEAMHNLQSSENMLLEDGDVIFVENNTNLVKVSGEVYFPTIIPYREKEHLKYYISKSGSYTPLARKSNVLVIYPDGKAKKVKQFLFFKSYPKLVSRAEIFVPQKSAKNKQKVSIGEWAVLLSSVAIVAGLIIK